MKKMRRGSGHERVMTGSGHFVEIQATAEGRPFSGSEMQDLLRWPRRAFDG